MTQPKIKSSLANYRAMLRGTELEPYAEDVYAKEVAKELLLSGDSVINERVQTSLNNLIGMSAASYNPGEYASQVRESMKGLLPTMDKDAGAYMRATTGADPILGVNFDALLGPSTAELEESMRQDSFRKTDQQLYDENRGPSFWESMERGILNDIGFVSATAGLATNAAADWFDSDTLKSAGDWMLDAARNKFDEAEEINQPKGTIGWVVDLVGSQLPTMALTLGSGVLAKGIAKGVLGAPVKGAVRKALTKEVAEGIAKSTSRDVASKEVQEATAKLLTKEVIDSLSDRAILEVARKEGIGAVEKTLTAKMFRLDPMLNVALDAKGVSSLAKQAFTKGNLFKEKVVDTVAAATGVFGASYAINAGDMFNELDQVAQEEADRTGKPKIDVTFGDVGWHAAVAAGVDSISATMFLKKFGLMEGNGFDFVKKIAKKFKAADPGTFKQYALGTLKDGLREGSTEALQSMVAVEAKREFINKWPQLNNGQKQEVLPFLFDKPEHITRYIEEFMGGAVLGGLMSPVGTAMENSRNTKAKAKQDAEEKAFLEKYATAGATPVGMAGVIDQPVEGEQDQTDDSVTPAEAPTPENTVLETLRGGSKSDAEKAKEKAEAAKAKKDKAQASKDSRNQPKTEIVAEDGTITYSDELQEDVAGIVIDNRVAKNNKALFKSEKKKADTIGQAYLNTNAKRTGGIAWDDLPNKDDKKAIAKELGLDPATGKPLTEEQKQQATAPKATTKKTETKKETETETTSTGKLKQFDAQGVKDLEGAIQDLESLMQMPAMVEDGNGLETIPNEERDQYESFVKDWLTDLRTGYGPASSLQISEEGLKDPGALANLRNKLQSLKDKAGNPAPPKTETSAPPKAETSTPPKADPIADEVSEMDRVVEDAQNEREALEEQTKREQEERDRKAREEANVVSSAPENETSEERYIREQQEAQAKQEAERKAKQGPVTPEQRQELEKLGYPKAEIDPMISGAAQTLIDNQVRKVLPDGTTVPDVTTAEGKREFVGNLFPSPPTEENTDGQQEEVQDQEADQQEDTEEEADVLEETPGVKTINVRETRARQFLKDLVDAKTTKEKTALARKYNNEAGIPGKSIKAAQADAENIVGAANEVAEETDVEQTSTPQEKAPSPTQETFTEQQAEELMGLLEEGDADAANTIRNNLDSFVATIRQDPDADAILPVVMQDLNAYESAEGLPLSKLPALPEKEAKATPAEQSVDPAEKVAEGGMSRLESLSIKFESLEKAKKDDLGRPSVFDKRGSTTNANIKELNLLVDILYQGLEPKNKETRHRAYVVLQRAFGPSKDFGGLPADLRALLSEDGGRGKAIIQGAKTTEKVVEQKDKDIKPQRDKQTQDAMDFLSMLELALTGDATVVGTVNDMKGKMAADHGLNANLPIGDFVTALSKLPYLKSAFEVLPFGVEKLLQKDNSKSMAFDPHGRQNIYNLLDDIRFLQPTRIELTTGAQYAQDNNIPDNTLWAGKVENGVLILNKDNLPMHDLHKILINADNPTLGHSLISQLAGAEFAGIQQRMEAGLRMAGVTGVAPDMVWSTFLSRIYPTGMGSTPFVGPFSNTRAIPSDIRVDVLDQVFHYVRKGLGMTKEGVTVDNDLTSAKMAAEFDPLNMYSHDVDSDAYAAKLVNLRGKFSNLRIKTLPSGQVNIKVLKGQVKDAVLRGERAPYIGGTRESILIEKALNLNEAVGSPVGVLQQLAKWAESLRPNSKQITELSELKGGYDNILSRLHAEAGNKTISREAVDFAQWFLRANPAMVDGLKLSVRGPGGALSKDTLGFFDAVNNLVVLMSNQNADETFVHEVLHYLENLLPPDIQYAIKEEWNRRLNRTLKDSMISPEFRTFLGMAKEADHGATDFMPMAEVEKLGLAQLADQEYPGWRIDKELSHHKVLGLYYSKNHEFMPKNAYQFYNASEFWAENGTGIMQKWFDTRRAWGKDKTLFARVRDWFRDMIEWFKWRMKWQSDTPLLRALKHVTGSTDLTTGAHHQIARINTDEDYLRQTSPGANLIAKEQDPAAQKDMIRAFGLKWNNVLDKVAEGTPLGNIMATSTEKELDISSIRRFLSMPSWATKGDPLLEEMYHTMVVRMEDSVLLKQEIMDKMTKFLERSKETDVLSKQMVENVEKMLIQFDDQGVDYTSINEVQGLPFKPTQEEFEMYRGVREGLDQIKGLIVSDIQQSIEMIETKVVDGVMNDILEEFDDTYKKYQKALTQLRNAKDQMESSHGYFPRVRPSNFRVTYFDANGAPQSEGIKGDPSGRKAELLAQARKKELEGSGMTKVEVTQVRDRFSPDSDLKSIEIKNLLTDVLTEAGANEDLMATLDNIMYAHGFSKHMLGRQTINQGKGGVGGTEVKIGGYQTDNLAGILIGHIGSFSHHHTGAVMASRLKELAETKGPDGKLMIRQGVPGNKNRYELMTQMLRTANKAADGMDKVVNSINTAAYHTWIGLRVSSALWNSAHIHMFGSALLRTEITKHNNDPKNANSKINQTNMLGLSGSIMKAHKDAAVFMRIKHTKGPGGKVTQEDMPNLTPGEIESLNKYHAIAKQQTMSAQTFEAVMDRDAPMYKRAWNKYKQWAGYLMHTTEVANRMASNLAHYRIFGDEVKAATFTRDLNASYEKFNLPGWLQANGFGRLLQPMLYTFGTHVQNTYEMMWYMAKHDRAALAYGIGAASIIGGVPAKEMWDVLWKHTVGENMDKDMEAMFGKYVARATRTGLISPLLDFDAGRSLALGPPPIFNFLDAFLGQGQEHAVVSPINGMIDAWKGEKPLYKIIPVKSWQGLGQAYHDYDQGLRIGPQRIYDASGKPLKLVPHEAAMVAMGLTPIRMSDAQFDGWNESDINRTWNARKTVVTNAYQWAQTPLERIAAQRAMREFNRKLAIQKRQSQYAFLKTKPATTNIRDGRGIRQTTVESR